VCVCVCVRGVEGTHMHIVCVVSIPHRFTAWKGDTWEGTRWVREESKGK
jgi:hypothetical protein